MTRPRSGRYVWWANEAAKIYERIISKRLVQHLGMVGLDLHPDQFGFREERSTIDAIARVRSLAESAVEDGRVSMLVTLDIKNAFNTLPWGEVERAAELFGFPLYLRLALRDYFRGREFKFPTRDGLTRTRSMYCTAGSHRGRFWTPYCGTSRTTGYYGLPSPPVHRWFVTLMIRR